MDNMPVKKKHSFFGTVLPLMILLTAVTLVGLNEYTDLKPLDKLSERLGIQAGAVTVSGRYECFFPEKDLGGGVLRSAQTWAYVFYSDGTYTTYVNDIQQFSGTWSQSGRTLTINTPDIVDVIQAHSSNVTVSADGNSFKVDEESTYVKVSED